MALGPKNPKNGLNLKVLFSGFLKGVNQIDHEESENRDHEALGSIPRALGSKDFKMGLKFKVIILGFPKRYKPNRPRGIRKSWSRFSLEWDLSIRLRDLKCIST